MSKVWTCDYCGDSYPIRSDLDCTGWLTFQSDYCTTVGRICPGCITPALDFSLRGPGYNLRISLEAING